MKQSEVRQMYVRHNPGVRVFGRKGFWYRCAHCGKWCGRPGGERANIQDYELMEVDHIKPWSQGGGDSVWNLQPLCKPCNRAKLANPTFGDNVKTFGNAIMHPADALMGVGRKAVRQNKVLKALGIGTRK